VKSDLDSYNVTSLAASRDLIEFNPSLININMDILLTPHYSESCHYEKVIHRFNDYLSFS
jgi:hypothetical protein